MLRSIGEIDKSLLYLRRTIETRQDTADFHTIVSTADVLSEIIVQVAIIDAKGIMRASNAGPQPAPAIDLSDREHYRVHLNSDEDQPVHQQAGRRPRQQAMVGAVHAALPEQRRQVRRRRGGLAQPGAPDRLLQQDRFRILDLDRADRQRRRGPFERRQQRRLRLGQDLSNTAMFRHAQTAATRHSRTSTRRPAKAGWSRSARFAAIRCGQRQQRQQAKSSAAPGRTSSSTAWPA